MNFVYNHCDLCGRFHKCEPGSAWKMVYSGYPPEPDHEATRCKPCVDMHGPMAAQHGIRPERSTGIVRAADMTRRATPGGEVSNG